MTTGLLIGAALALLASLFLNGSYLIQHLGSQASPAITLARPLATLRGLLASPLWLAGTLAGLLGWAIHVLALSRAPLSLVQAFSAGGLAVAVPLAALITRSALPRSERVAVVLMGGALALLAVGAGGVGATAVPVTPMLVFLVLVAGGAAALAGLRTSTRRPHALGLAAGVLYGAADAATKAATTAAHGSLVGGLSSPWVVGVVVASLAAFFCFQRALQLGSVMAVIALMTAATNLTAILGGLVVFAEPLGSSPLTATLHAGALVLVGLAAWRLAPAQARLSEATPMPQGPAAASVASRS